MLIPRHTKLQVPVELSRYVYRHCLITPFSIYLYLKLFSDGKIHESSPVFDRLRRDLRMSDRRTFKKHIEKLIQLKWVGFNPKSGYYFIRSFGLLRYIHSFRKRTASEFTLKNIKHVQAYLVGVILSVKVKGQQYYWERKNPSRHRTATSKADVANHSKVRLDRPSYYGLSVNAIADELGCKSTRASVLKNYAAKLGYIKVRKRFSLYATLQKADYVARPMVNDLYPQLKGQFRIVPRVIKGVSRVDIMVQLHDEITPKLKFKTISKFNNLKVSPAMARHVERLAKAAA